MIDIFRRNGDMVARVKDWAAAAAVERLFEDEAARIAENMALSNLVCMPWPKKNVILLDLKD